jgi:hypothetical protein
MIKKSETNTNKIKEVIFLKKNKNLLKNLKQGHNHV